MPRGEFDPRGQLPHPVRRRRTSGYESRMRGDRGPGIPCSPAASHPDGPAAPSPDLPRRLRRPPGRPARPGGDLARASGRRAVRRRPSPVVAVRLIRPQLRAPSPPPALGRPAPRPHVPATEPRTARMVQPREVPVELPPDAGVEDAHAAGAGRRGGPVRRGLRRPARRGDRRRLRKRRTAPPCSRLRPRPPIAARTHDLASVRAGIARTLVYPPNARRNGLQGKVVLEFVLLAEGRIRDLVLRSSSGHPRRSTRRRSPPWRRRRPFPPPGVDVLVVVPVVFRSE